MASKRSIRFALLLLPLFTCACWATKPVKQLRWHDYVFELAVADGGATTSFSWRVTARHQGWFGVREEQLFEAYGGPYLTDLQLEDSTLVLVAKDEGKLQRIEVDLQHLDTFLQEPIRYYRYTLKQNNPYYHEPAFLATARQHEQDLASGAAQQQDEQQRAEHHRQEQAAGWSH